MIRCAPGTRETVIGLNVDCCATIILRSVDIRNHGLADRTAVGTGGPPMLRIPNRNHAILVGTKANLQITAGPGPGDLQFLVAIEHELDRPAGLLADTSGGSTPIVRR